MKPRYLIGGIILILFAFFALRSFNLNKIDYSNFDGASSTSNVVQVSGALVKEKSYAYDSEKNEFTFYMKDDKAKEVKVIFSGAKPNNFDLAPKVVVKGSYKNNCFYATEILTKCPSKYEGKAEQVI